MNKHRLFILITTILTACAGVCARPGSNYFENTTPRGSIRINPATHDTELELPLTEIPGRGMTIPVTLFYSSANWRFKEVIGDTSPSSAENNCSRVIRPLFSERAASGWTTSLDAPVIEYVGGKSFYDVSGIQSTPAEAGCYPASTGRNAVYVRRLLVHLPGRETHELLPVDHELVEISDYPGDTRGPGIAANWDAVYNSVDGSNLRFIHDTANGILRLQLPDGTYYDFEGSDAEVKDRTATRVTDRHGNSSTYNLPDRAHPQRYIVDTLGRQIIVPFPTAEHNSTSNTAATHTISLPGMSVPVTFHWKRLKGESPNESGLTDFNQNLRSDGDASFCGDPENLCLEPAGTSLFTGRNVAVANSGIFNPMVLTSIEIPGGGQYRFTYDVYGRMETMRYPNGGLETLAYETPTEIRLSDTFASDGKANKFAVSERRLYRSPTDPNPFRWNYSSVETDNEVKLTTNEFGSGRIERVLKGSSSIYPMPFGATDLLAGSLSAELTYAVDGSLEIETLLTWSIIGDETEFKRKPALSQRERRFFNSDGTGISAVTRYEYNRGDNQKDSPLLLSRVEDFDFVSIASEPPARPARSVELKYVQTDLAIAEDRRRGYLGQNLGGLETERSTRDGNRNLLELRRVVFDEDGTSPLPPGRGNASAIMFWDSGKGPVDNPDAYSKTDLRFDQFGNVTSMKTPDEITVAVEFDAQFHAFPAKITRAMRGSDPVVVAEATFDPATGRPVKVIDKEGVHVHFSYDATTSRLVGVERRKNDLPDGGASFSFGAMPHGPTIHTILRTGNNRVQESTALMDGLGRIVKTLTPTSRGNLVVEKEYDGDGREVRVTEPYLDGSTKFWTQVAEDDPDYLEQFPSTSGKSRAGVLISDLIGNHPLDPSGYANRRKVGVLISDFIDIGDRIPDCSQIPDAIGVLVSDLIGQNGSECSDVRKRTGVLISDIVGAPFADTDCPSGENLVGVLISDLRGPATSPAGCVAERRRVGVLISDIAGTATELRYKSGEIRIQIADALGRVVRTIDDPGDLNRVTNYQIDAAGNIRRLDGSQPSIWLSHDTLGRPTFAFGEGQFVNQLFDQLDPVTRNHQWSRKYEYDAVTRQIRETNGDGVVNVRPYETLSADIRRDLFKGRGEVCGEQAGNPIELGLANMSQPVRWRSRPGNMSTGNLALPGTLAVCAVK